MPLAQCFSPIFDGRDPNKSKLIERGQRIEIEPDEIWPGVKYLGKHFTFLDSNLSFPEVKKSEVKEKVEKPEKKKRVFKCSSCDKVFKDGFALGKHKKVDHPQN